MRRGRRTETLSLLEGALLGLLHAQPQSGYQLRKAFQETPLAHFSDSPGSIYPALARLRARGRIRGTVERAGTLRPRERFALTRDGELTLQTWLSEPVTRETVRHGTDEAMLRFAFLEGALGRRATTGFLRDLARELADYLEWLRAWHKARARAQTLTGRLALESGIASVDAQLRWAHRAARRMAAVEKAP